MFRGSYSYRDGLESRVKWPAVIKGVNDHRKPAGLATSNKQPSHQPFSFLLSSPSSSASRCARTGNKAAYRVTLVVANLDWVGLNFLVPMSALFCMGKWDFGRTGLVAAILIKVTPTRLRRDQQCHPVQRCKHPREHWRHWPDVAAASLFQEMSEFFKQKSLEIDKQVQKINSGTSNKEPVTQRSFRLPRRR